MTDYNFRGGKAQPFAPNFGADELMGWVMWHEETQSWAIVAYESQNGLMPMIATAENKQVVEMFDRICAEIAHQVGASIRKVKYSNREVIKDITPDDWEPGLDDFGEINPN